MAKKKGKKKSGAKLAKMTEEERILYLEQKALAEAELRKKKEEMLMLFLKEKLAAEEKSSKMNMLKLNTQWRQIMREAKSQDLRKEIEILSQTFERIVDRKNSVIKALSADAEEADEQYNKALRSHLFNVDQLIDNHRRRVATIEEQYLQALSLIRMEFDHERELTDDCHKREIERLRDIIFAMEQNALEHENEAKQEFQSIRDEIKNKEYPESKISEYVRCAKEAIGLAQNLEDKHALRIQLEGTVELLWKQFQNALKDYNETTEDRKVAFEILKAKDERSAREIDSQMRRLQKIHEKIAGLRGKMQQNSKENDGRNRQLREQKEIVQKHFQLLKADMNRMREEEKQRLTTMTLQSTKAIKKLKGILERGDRILRLAEMCRKMETEQEKVLPFYASSFTEEELEDIEAAVMETPSEPLASVMHDYTALENFWKRYNKVLLDELVLEKKKADLTEENHQLRSFLKQYLDGISVNEEVLSDLNPLLIVNERSNLKHPSTVSAIDPRVRRHSQNIIELKQVVRHYKSMRK